MRMQNIRQPQPEDGSIVRHNTRRKQSFWQRFVENYIPNKNDTAADIARKLLLVVAVFVLIGAIVYISSYFGESKNNKAKNANLQSIWEQMAQKGDEAEDIDVDDDYPKDYIKKFYPLYQQNPDIRGWITINGTQVNYPVMQTKNNVDYDRFDFEKKDNDHGIPFADYRVNLKKPSTNTIIYGHNMTDGQMFGELINYKQLSYYKQHPTMTFDSVYATGQYKIAAIILCKANDNNFLYHNFIDADKNTSKMNMTQFISKIRERSLINTTVDIKPTDKLITLSTCDYDFKDPVTNERIARFIIIGRKVREGEDATVDIDNAKINPNPVMPKEWAQFIQKQQAAELKAQQESEASKQYGPIREEAAKWFTTAELAAIKDENLEIEIARRKESMSQYLNATELASLTADQKVALLKERQSGVDLEEEARNAILNNADLAFMTDSEINAFAKELAKTSKSNWASLMKSRTTASAVELSIEPTTLKIMKGDTRNIDAFTNGGSGNVKWSSESSAIASISSDGFLTAKKAGSTVITASYSGRTATCKVTVTNDEVIETTISMSSNVNLFVNSTITLTPSISPDNIAERGVKWSITSGKNYVEIIDSTINDITLLGLVEGKTAKVTATTRDGVTATCTISIKSEDSKVSISPSSTSLEIGKTTTLVLSSDAAKARWTIRGNAAKISASDNTTCTIEAVEKGTATVTAKLTNGQELTASITVKEVEETVTINASPSEIKVGKGSTITISSSNVKAKTWKSSNDSIASVSGDEVSASVAGNSPGKVTITATLSNGKTATCQITVKEDGGGDNPTSSDKPASSDKPTSSNPPPTSSDNPTSSNPPPTSSDNPTSSNPPPTSSDPPPTSSNPPPTSSETSSSSSSTSETSSSSSSTTETSSSSSSSSEESSTPKPEPEPDPKPEPTPEPTPPAPPAPPTA